jgi:hypothetical protein
VAQSATTVKLDRELLLESWFSDEFHKRRWNPQCSWRHDQHNHQGPKDRPEKFQEIASAPGILTYSWSVEVRDDFSPRRTHVF